MHLYSPVDASTCYFDSHRANTCCDVVVGQLSWDSSPETPFWFGRPVRRKKYAPTLHATSLLVSLARLRAPWHMPKTLLLHAWPCLFGTRAHNGYSTDPHATFVASTPELCLLLWTLLAC